MKILKPRKRPISNLIASNTVRRVSKEHPLLWPLQSPFVFLRSVVGQAPTITSIFQMAVGYAPSAKITISVEGLNATAAVRLKLNLTLTESLNTSLKNAVVLEPLLLAIAMLTIVVLHKKVSQFQERKFQILHKIWASRVTTLLEQEMSLSLFSLLLLSLKVFKTRRTSQTILNSSSLHSSNNSSRSKSL